MKSLTAMLLFACGALGGCAGASDRPADAAATLAELRAIGRDASCSSDQQCKTVALGAKPCGGPEAWLAWSSQRSDGGQVGKLAERYKQQRMAQHQQSGVVGECSMVPDPGAVCRASHCQLNAGVTLD
jgi:hypothetical protein